MVESFSRVKFPTISLPLLPIDHLTDMNLVQSSSLSEEFTNDTVTNGLPIMVYSSNKQYLKR